MFGRTSACPDELTLYADICELPVNYVEGTFLVVYERSVLSNTPHHGPVSRRRCGWVDEGHCR